MNAAITNEYRSINIESARAMLAKRPDATIAVVETGRHVDARFQGVCKLTADVIHAGERIAPVVLLTRSGHLFDGFITVRLMKAMQLTETTSYSRCADDWMTALDSIPVGGSITVMKKGASADSMITYKHTGDNEWRRGIKYASTATVKATLNRTECILYRTFDR